MSEDTAQSRQLTSVRRAFEIIKYLQTEGPATLSMIAEAFDMPMSTAHIHLSTLVKTGYIVRSEDQYRCSLRFLQTGGQLRDHMPLYIASKNEIDDLHKKSGEVVNVVTEERGYLIQLYKSTGQNTIDDNAELGAHLHLHSTSTGEAILSALPQHRVEEILEQRGLPAITQETIVDKEELYRELDETHVRGYSINSGEHFSGVRAIGTPILSKSEVVLGAISISGPLNRMDDERIANDLAPKLMNKKNVIELHLLQSSILS